jgi:hypothetical protein
VVFTTAPLNESSGTDGADRADMATEVGGYPQGGHWAVACVRAVSVCVIARACVWGARALSVLPSSGRTWRRATWWRRRKSA